MALKKKHIRNKNIQNNENGFIVDIPCINFIVFEF